jgi:hypothetical protein
MRKKSYNKRDKDLVLTPGGYRPKSSVKQVDPNEIVRRNKNGTYEVIERELPPKRNNEVESSEQQGTPSSD